MDSIKNIIFNKYPYLNNYNYEEQKLIKLFLKREDFEIKKIKERKTIF